jgi:hypothetical protein
MKFVGDLDYWEEEDFQCSSCIQTWKGKQLKFSDLEGDIGEMACPRCNKVLVGVCAGSLKPAGSPTKQPPTWASDIAMIVAGRHEYWKQNKLTCPEQLPEVAGESFEIIWDLGPDVTGKPAEALLDQGYIFRVGDQIIWAEPSFFEDYDRYPEVSAIFVAKYGGRLKDIKITPSAAKNMLGDSLRAGEFIDRARRQFFFADEKGESDWLTDRQP